MLHTLPSPISVVYVETNDEFARKYEIYVVQPRYFYDHNDNLYRICRFLWWLRYTQKLMKFVHDYLVQGSTV